jgi:hypothetical protein
MNPVVLAIAARERWDQAAEWPSTTSVKTP